MLIVQKAAHRRGEVITDGTAADTTRVELIAAGSSHVSPQQEKMISEIVSLIFAGGHQARLVGSMKGLAIEIP